MKRYLISTLIILFALKGYTQITFEKGFFIDGSGKRTECFIKNVDWKYNPTKFEYKLSMDTDTETGSISSVKEFGIDGYSKYIRAKVKIDRSSDEIKKLSHKRLPDFQEDVIFLKQLIEGDANLFLYEYGNLRKYFFSTDSIDVMQLVYKLYKVNDQRIGKNETFKMQLWNHLKCGEVSLKDVEKIDYNGKDLSNFFTSYNACKNPLIDTNSKGYVKPKRPVKDVFNLTVRPGINLSSLSVDRSSSGSQMLGLTNEVNFRLGIESEAILPFNKNKWSIIFEPTYSSFEGETDRITQTGNSTLSPEKVTVDYRSIGLPIGLRHYFFLNEKAKFFLNGAYKIEITGDSFIDFERSFNLEISSVGNFAFGSGFKYADRLSLEIRYDTKKDILQTYSSLLSEYSSLAFIFGYSIF